MGRTYAIDSVPRDPSWWGSCDAGRFTLMAIEDDLLDADDIGRLWGTTDLGEVRSAIEERAERLSTAKGRGEARGLRVVTHEEKVYEKNSYGKQKKTPHVVMVGNIPIKPRNARVGLIMERLAAADEAQLSAVERALGL